MTVSNHTPRNPRINDGDTSAQYPHLFERTVAQSVVHTGTVITTRRDEAELPDGQRATRDVVEHPGGVVILPVLDDGRILLVRQWRYPLGRTLIEVPAGKLDPGEHADPMAAARRELMEETGYEPAHMEELTSIYTSPGFCDERLWLYKATGLRKIADHNDVKADDEFIDLLTVTVDEAFAMARSGEILDAKTLCLFWFLATG